MTTSGISTFNITRDEIIKMALEDCFAYAPDLQDPTPGQISRASVRLNAMIKAWQAAGVGLWLNQECTLPLAAGAQSYTLGPSGSHCAASSNMGETALAVAGSAGSVTITVDSITGIVNGMNIGIELDNNSIQWTTVNGAPAGATVTLTAALTGSAAVDSVVFFYTATNKIARPMGIVEARVRTLDGTDIPLYIGSRDEYMALPVKTSEGTPTQVYYDPQMDNSVLYVWPISTDMSRRIRFTARMPIQVFNDLDDTPHFPAEWVDALHYSLAVRLPSALRMPADEYSRLTNLAVIALKDANEFDREFTSMYFEFNAGPGRW